MGSEFSIKLGRFAKKLMLANVPGAPQGRTFGYVSAGIELPPGADGYVVEFESESSSQVRILAYVDAYGRVFAGPDVQTKPPARYPSLTIVSFVDENNETGAVEIRFADKGAVNAAEFTCKNIDDLSKATFCLQTVHDSSLKPQQFAQNMGYKEFMATLFLSLMEFEADRAEKMEIYDLQSVARRLETPNVFDAIANEVLEAEQLAASESGVLSGAEEYLVHMLREEGLVGKAATDLRLNAAEVLSSAGLPAVGVPADAFFDPNVRLLRTVNYADTYFVDFSYQDANGILEDGGFSFCEATYGNRCKLLSTEAAINRFFLLCQEIEQEYQADFSVSAGWCSKLDQWIMDNICAQVKNPSTPANLDSKWDIHFAFARACESLKLPYRVSYKFHSNEDCSALGMNVMCPGADVMPKSQWDDDQGAFVITTQQQKSADAARYAAHLALLCAACGFATAASIQKVCINCLMPKTDNPYVASVEFDRQEFCAQWQAASNPGIADPFAFMKACGGRYQFGDDFELLAIDPLFHFDQGEFAFTGERELTLDETPFNEEARSLMGVSNAKEMCIFEDGMRKHYADVITEALDKGKDEAVACIKSIHDKTEDVVVRRICNGLLMEFDLDELGFDMYLSIKQAFNDAYDFRPLMTRAYALMETEDPSAVSVLEELLAKIEALDAFKDTDAVCYRFFDSYESRAMYELRCKDDKAGRVVRPLPDEVLLVHDALSQAYTESIMGSADAMKHAEMCIQLAPARAFSYLRVARVHFMQGNFQQEIDFCKKALEVAVHAEETAVAYYWMAFAFWQLGKYEAALACYKFCILIDSSVTGHARMEAEDLLQSVKGLKRRSLEDDEKLLKDEGVNVEARLENGRFLMDVAKAAVDSGVYSLGCTLGSAASRIVRDDALLPTLYSVAY